VPTIYLYTAEEQVVQQIGSAGLPATLRLDVSPDADVKLYEVLEGTPSSIAIVKTLDIILQPVVDDTPPVIGPVPLSTTIFLWQGEIPYLASSPISVVSADVQLQISPDADVKEYENIPSLASGLQFLKAVDILLSPTDYFITGGTTILIVQDSVHGHAVDGIVLIQQHTLIVQESSHAHIVDGLILVEHRLLVVQDSIHGHGVDGVVLIVYKSLIIQDSLHEHSADNIILIEHKILVVQDSLHTHLIDGIALIEHKILVVQNSDHSLASDNVILTQIHYLSIQDAQHDHTSDIVLLFQLHILYIYDGLHTHSVENAVLGSGFPIITMDADLECAVLAGDVGDIEMVGSIFSLN
jgi:hypothetical protein